MTESESPWALHQTLTDSFLALARDQYGSSRGTVDPDVQVGLGTAYYMMGEYEEARNCWVAALGERPDVSGLFADCFCGMVGEADDGRTTYYGID
jgi:peroxin-5